MGGENVSDMLGSVRKYGSSPRGRGKQLNYTQGRGLHRLIPAWAGKTINIQQHATPGKAHPRVGGENIPSRLWEVNVTGSSPRGRGKLFITHNTLQWIRLIPAWAGKTHEHGVDLSVWWAHPRVGGENTVKGI